MPGPLQGIRLVELSAMITGPLTGMLLADMGAEVIKIENPEGGDPFRSYGGGQYIAQYCLYDRNKRSVAVSLRTDLGRRALDALVRRSDVLLENCRPACSIALASMPRACASSIRTSSTARSRGSVPTSPKPPIRAMTRWPRR